MLESIYLHDLKTTATQNRPDCCQSRATEKPGGGDELETFMIQEVVY
jgi:anaerobic ribonucleoside-triphosphate reductase